MNELINLDPTFTESAFKTKVDNMFIMLHYSFMTENLNRVAHFISKSIYEKYEQKLNDLENKNFRQMYDELNVKQSNITDVIINDDKFIIKVLIVSRYIDYIIDKNTNKIISGNSTYRVEKNNHLTLEKKRNFKIQKVARTCPHCGANMSVNTTGVCEYCNGIYDQENYDWVITHIETL
ncbi:MAG: TIM44-like domain-containing protein [Clostridium sp.]|nr:TIM44-like domain-containing protein [Clostridium sp.]MCM1444736.1 TIM44-like domain-containing protein [Candidatus Amulumruptor caecigallinarius]